RVPGGRQRRRGAAPLGEPGERAPRVDDVGAAIVDGADVVFGGHGGPWSHAAWGPDESPGGPWPQAFGVCVWREAPPEGRDPAAGRSRREVSERSGELRG